MLSMGSATAPAMADLVILGQYQGPQLAHPLPIAHSVVSRCGRSVLVVPDQWAHLVRTRRDC